MVPGEQQKDAIPFTSPPGRKTEFEGPGSIATLSFLTWSQLVDSQVGRTITSSSLQTSATRYIGWFSWFNEKGLSTAHHYQKDKEKQAQHEELQKPLQITQALHRTATPSAALFSRPLTALPRQNRKGHFPWEQLLLVCKMQYGQGV